jgi:hypothetical protein
MKPLPPLDKCIELLDSRIDLHHVAAKFLYKTHKKPTHCQVFVAAALHRSISLIHGFCTLIPENFLCAASLIRLQLDSALRFSTLWLVADPEDFAKRVASGEPVNTLKDRDGQQLRDGYLVRKLNERYPGMDKCYDDGCGYVHLSDFHFYHVQDRTDDGKFRLQIVFVEAYLQQKDPTNKCGSDKLPCPRSRAFCPPSTPESHPEWWPPRSGSRGALWNTRIGSSPGSNTMVGPLARSCQPM